MREIIASAMKNALKEKDQISLSTIRLISAALKDRDIENRTKKKEGDTSDAEIFNLFQSMIKQRKDSVSQFKSAGRDELSKKEEDEISIIQEFMPEQLSEEEIKELIEKVIIETEAKSMKEMGKVMGKLKELTSGKADAGYISSEVKKALG